MEINFQDILYLIEISRPIYYMILKSFRFFAIYWIYIWLFLKLNWTTMYFIRLNSLRRLLHGCNRLSCFEYSGYSSSHKLSLPQSDFYDVPTIRLDLYFGEKSRDFGLLMDLLAEASGIVQSLRWNQSRLRDFRKVKFEDLFIVSDVWCYMCRNHFKKKVNKKIIEFTYAHLMENNI